MHAYGQEPLVVMRSSADLSALPMRPLVASQSKFMAPMEQPRAGYSMQPLRASMPGQEEYAVASAESQTKKGRREIMGNFARAAAFGAVAAATKDRAALADEEDDGLPPPAAPSKREIVFGNIAKLAAVPAIALGWVGFNIGGGA